MAGFTLKDSAEFDDWQVFQSESLRRLYGAMLEKLVECQSRVSDYKAAIEIARRWLVLDDLDE